MKLKNPFLKLKLAKIKVEIGCYESFRILEVEVPDHSLESAKLAYQKGKEELKRLWEDDPENFDDYSHVVQLWTPDGRCLYDFFNGFSLYYPASP